MKPSLFRIATSVVILGGLAKMGLVSAIHAQATSNDCPHAVIVIATPNQTNQTNRVLTFTATLNGANERPTPVSTPGSGRATFTINGNQLSVDIPYLGLVAPLTVAHIHGPATTNEAAGVLIGLVPEIPALATRSGRIQGAVPVTQAQIDMMLSGMTYVNLHTSLNPSGEIRGQLVQLQQNDFTVISPDGDPVHVIFDGSTSWDSNGDPLTYAWYELPATNNPSSDHGKKSSKKHSGKGHGNGNGNGNRACDAVAELTLRYTGTNNSVAVGVAQKGRAVLFFDILNAGDEFTFEGYGRNDDMSPEIAVFVNGNMNATFDTSGRTVLAVGASSGNFTVVNGTTVTGGSLCGTNGMEGRMQFGDDVVAERSLDVGTHLIELVVSDGTCEDSTVIQVEVLSASGAVGRCIEAVGQMSIGNKLKNNLTKALETVARDLDRGRQNRAINGLHDFIDQVEGSNKLSAADKATLRDCAQSILDMM